MAELLVADLKRLTIHDGPGIRDTLFLKGCPLRCLWCHNPETISGRPNVLFYPDLCTKCRRCVAACPQHCHTFEGEEHRFDRTKCTRCGRCVEACYFEALRFCGKRVPVLELFQKMMQERTFFAAGGGITVSGGEPLLQAEGVLELFQLFRAEKVHTALDTCGAVAQEAFDKVLPYTSLVLFDLKGMDAARHKTNTGMDNALIHENLRHVDAVGVPIEIRMPIIPQHNDFADDAEKTAELLASLRHLERVRLLAYHDMARKKYAEAGLPDTMPQVPPPEREALEAIQRTLQKRISAEILLP